MKPFECQGYWWTPSRPEKCAGLLKCNESGELRLFLFGSFGKGSDWPTGKDCPIIFGEILDLAGSDNTAPKGRCVTLLDSFVNNQHHSSSGPSTQSYFSHRAFIGDQFLSGESTQFALATFSLSGLGSWASDVKGIRPGPVPHFSKSWERPEDIEVPFPKGKALLGLTVEANETARQWTLQERLAFQLTYSSLVTDSELSKDVWAFQNLLTFATDRPNALTRLDVEQTPSGSKSPLVVIGPSVFDDEKAAEKVHTRELLFAHADVSNRFGDVLHRWFQMSERHSAAFAIYFGLKYNPPRYSDHRLQLMAQAISLYSTGGVGRRPLIALPYKYSEPIEPAVRDELVRTHPFIVFANALHSLTERYGVVFDPLIGAHDSRSRDTFLSAATQTFQYVMGRESGAPPETSRGVTYYWLTELLGLLWKIALLDELGFTIDQQQKLLARNEMYQHIRQKIAPEMFGTRSDL